MGQSTAPSTPKAGEKSQPKKPGRPRRAPEVAAYVVDLFGECHPVNLAPKPSPKARSLGLFVRQSTQSLADLAAKPLAPTARQVLDYLLSVSGWENALDVRQHEISTALGLKQPNVARAIKQLSERGLVVEDPFAPAWRPGVAKRYILNPFVFAKGRDGNNTRLQERVSAQRNEALQALKLVK